MPNRYYVVTLCKYIDNAIYRRLCFAKKEDAMNYIKTWSKSKKVYVARIQCLEV